uniref:Uncharacterized protein n=1 Tax=Arundo donax TaxID=35708 RepID=A0A0A9BX34_ARUDO
MVFSRYSSMKKMWFLYVDVICSNLVHI